MDQLSEIRDITNVFVRKEFFSSKNSFLFTNWVKYFGKILDFLMNGNLRSLSPYFQSVLNLVWSKESQMLSHITWYHQSTPKLKLYVIDFISFEGFKNEFGSWKRWGGNFKRKKHAFLRKEMKWREYIWRSTSVFSWKSRGYEKTSEINTYYFQ